MKKLLLLLLLMTLLPLTACAQRDVTKFLGIPVDGPKNAMIQKLKAKGFTYNQSKDILTGQFNDYDVELSIVTNNNKVSRILVADRIDVNEASIKIRFNKLCRQFEKNSKYLSMDDQTISEDDDISYNIRVKDKRYEAVFYQKPLSFDTLSIQNEIKEKLLEKYTQEEIDSHAEEIEKESNAIAQDILYDVITKSPVWFMISEKYGNYRILMYYDNEYNKSDGEDL